MATGEYRGRREPLQVFWIQVYLIQAIAILLSKLRYTHQNFDLLPHLFNIGLPYCPLNAIIHHYIPNPISLPTVVYSSWPFKLVIIYAYSSKISMLIYFIIQRQAICHLRERRLASLPNPLSIQLRYMSLACHTLDLPKLSAFWQQNL